MYYIKVGYNLIIVKDIAEHVCESNKSPLFMNRNIQTLWILLLLVHGLGWRINDQDISNAFHETCEKQFNKNVSLKKKTFIGEALQIVG